MRVARELTAFRRDDEVLLSHRRVERMFHHVSILSPNNDNYGRGWYLDCQHPNDVCHGGGFPGTGAMVYFFPSNTTSTHGNHRLRDVVFAMVFNRDDVGGTAVYDGGDLMSDLTSDAGAFDSLTTRADWGHGEGDLFDEPEYDVSCN